MGKGKVTYINTDIKFKEFNKQIYDQLFGQMLEGVLIVNSRGLVEYLNPSYQKNFGVSDFAIKGRSIYNTINDEIVLTSLKNKKNLQGYVYHPEKNCKYRVVTSVLVDEKLFKGILAIYHEEKDFQTFYRKNIKSYCNSNNTNKAFSNIIGNSKGIQEAIKIAEKAAKTNATVLISGETGTGKGVIAEAIHKASLQRDKPFVKVNCAAIPYNLLESELFGHEQGSFTGAIKKKIGKFEQANGGTIFLDEIGDMPIDMQVKVLRVIQEKEFERVGGNESIKCDVRIIAATHRNLKELIEQGLFREDLYYRLNVIPIYVPSLKERKEDIIDLTYHYMNKIGKEIGVSPKTLDREVEMAFASYDWPGNIRELKNLIERLMLIVDEPIIRLSDLPPEISKTYELNNQNIESNSLINLNIDGNLATMEEYEKEIIKLALKKYGSFNQVGKILGLTHKTVAAKARKYNLVE
ncbi:Transcriptional regulator containing PAS, AAA-type ATPase, and DNA-binding Fis domains [Anaerobranca californiensis DSM 14826]|jgi:transcriptional regulator with PAS, ATPase and Fis domain|uniref:HTH-type transcriptional regulatory protein TyrR n=1 Tax=Anaerobranca californiensis DSM 14826 TaxID=1120989 RepID=A0A1M6RBV3_9FIRM|nr:sigma 54-interacting transcriptional regulator [Anaerobranca californiensis]SHK29922.1 Transcriptional regulator containing PAS, AAA-type ATPase, and DNA-binding Fis domains [Anaerobranca californiensis DSM 14826]